MTSLHVLFRGSRILGYVNVNEHPQQANLTCGKLRQVTAIMELFSRQKSAAFQSNANLAVSFCADLAANFYKPRIVSEQIIRKVECLLMSTESYRQILSCRRYKLITDVVMR